MIECSAPEFWLLYSEFWILPSKFTSKPLVMFVPFENLPEGAKVWIYQSEKKFTEAEKNLISDRIESFINTWQSHGSDLKGSGRVLYDHFIILAIDESHYAASGCSIDKSVHFIKEIERELNTTLLNRSKQSYLAGNHVQFFPVNEAKKLINEGQLDRNTITFNNTIENKAELENKWLIPAEESWLKRFF